MAFMPLVDLLLKPIAFFQQGFIGITQFRNYRSHRFPEMGAIDTATRRNFLVN
jgi:hypothetical protein